MNILPKKSWHVRTRANIERVRRDEAQAAEEEKKRLKKVELAEQEARTGLLRAKAQQRLLHPGSDDKLPVGEASLQESSNSLVVSTDEDIRKHVNFFREVEDGKSTGGVNKEHEAEKKAEQEKYEKSIGLLTYLGQSAVESQTSKPWYLNTKNKTEEQDKDADDQTNDLKRKNRLDPMHTMNKYLGVKRQKEDPSRKTHRSSTSRTHCKPSTAQRTYTSKMEYVSPVQSKVQSKHHKDKHKKSKHKKDHKHKKHRHKDKSSHKDRNHKQSETKSAGPSIEQLRAERLRREIAEKARTERLLSGKKEPSVESLNKVSDVPDGRYNSMFHPELARKHRRKEFAY